MNPEIIPTPIAGAPMGILLGRLPDTDRESLSQAIQHLLAHGSIAGLEPSQASLYAWGRQNFEWLRELAAVSGLDVRCEHEIRLIQAIPKNPNMMLRLKQDATLVFLALWYEYDTQLRDHGATEVRLTVEDLNRLLKEKLLPDLKSIPAETRMREILRLAHRKNLIRLDLKPEFGQSLIEILTTLKQVIPFRDLEDWTRTAEAHLKPAGGLDADEEENNETQD
jgi:hypothetical protein